MEVLKKPTSRSLSPKPKILVVISLWIRMYERLQSNHDMGVSENGGTLI